MYLTKKKIIFDNSEQLKFGRYGLAGKHNFQEGGGGLFKKKKYSIGFTSTSKRIFQFFHIFSKFKLPKW